MSCSVALRNCTLRIKAWDDAGPHLALCGHDGGVHVEAAVRAGEGEVAVGGPPAELLGAASPALEPL